MSKAMVGESGVLPRAAGVTKAVRGNAPTHPGREAVEQGLEAMLGRLWRFALTQCGDGSVADDLVQATCIRALERAHQFQPGTRLDSWLYTILASIWRNMARANVVRRGAGLVDIADARLEALGVDAEKRVQLGHVLSAIQSLPSKQRVVMLMVCVEGLSYAETARILQVPIGTVMSRLSGARHRLRPLRE